MIPRDEVWVYIWTTDNVSRQELIGDVDASVGTVQGVLNTVIDNGLVEVESRNPLVVSRGDDDV